MDHPSHLVIQPPAGRRPDQDEDFQPTKESASLRPRHNHRKVEKRLKKQPPPTTPSKHVADEELGFSNTKGRGMTKFGLNVSEAPTAVDTARSTYRNQDDEALESSEEDSDDDPLQEMESQSGAFAVGNGTVRARIKNTIEFLRSGQVESATTLRRPTTIADVERGLVPASQTLRPLDPPFLENHFSLVDVPANTDKKDETISDRRRSCSIRVVLTLGGALFVALVVAVAVVFSSSAGDSSKPTPEPSSFAPTLAPESEQTIRIRQFLVSNNISSLEQLTDPLSPQYDALRWLADKDKVANLNERPEVLIERYVLAVFFYSLKGPSWMDGDLWLDENESICNWNRIHCHDSNGQVQSIIDDSATRMVGYLPSELNELPYLEGIQLPQNRIQGLKAPIKNLKTLYVDDNAFGEVQLGIPPEILQMTNLEMLRLVENGLIGTISSEIGNMASLQYLDLGRNGFTGTFPTELRRVTTLREIGFEENEIEGNIMDILLGLNRTLEYFVGASNRLSGNITTDIGTFTSLRLLALSTNRITGAFPNTIFSLQNLVRLDLAYNDITGTIGTEIGRAYDLERLGLDHNPMLRGSIPTEVGLVRNLMDLSLEFSNFEGPIPSEIGLCGALTSLAVGTNFLSGSIPTELGNLKSLEALRLDSNLLTGLIPTQLGTLSTLEYLALLGNNLTGDLTSEICALPLLSEVQLLGMSSSDVLTCGDCPKCY